MQKGYHQRLLKSYRSLFIYKFVTNSLSKNEFMFVFDLKSVGYEEKEKGQTLNFEDLSNCAPELGLEPRTL